MNEPTNDPTPATDKLLVALENYITSIKVGEKHATRLGSLVNRAQVLSEIHREMYQNLAADHEAVKDIIATTGESDTPAFVAFMEHHKETEVIYRLIQATLAEINSEKDFIDWHLANSVKTEQEAALKLLGDKP